MRVLDPVEEEEESALRIQMRQQLVVVSVVAGGAESDDSLVGGPARNPIESGAVPQVERHPLLAREGEDFLHDLAVTSPGYEKPAEAAAGS